MRLSVEDAYQRLASADHAVLCTTHEQRGIDAVPVCFAVVGRHVAVPIDRVKPKSSTELQRMKNLDRNPRATLLAEHWDAGDWSQLWWVRAGLTHIDAPAPLQQELAVALQAKHRQYHDAPFARLLAFSLGELTGWSAS